MHQTAKSYDANAAFEKIASLFQLPPLRKTVDLGAFKAAFKAFSTI